MPIVISQTCWFRCVWIVSAYASCYTWLIKSFWVLETKSSLCLLILISVLVFAFWQTGINTSDTYTKEWYQQQAVLRVSFGNFFFFAIYALIMIGVKDQNDRRDSWHHGGWGLKMIVWFLLVVLMFFVPNVIISIYGKFVFLLLIVSHIWCYLITLVYLIGIFIVWKFHLLLVLVYEFELAGLAISLFIFYALV